jgi:hypothetical protein
VVMLHGPNIVAGGAAGHPIAALCGLRRSVGFELLFHRLHTLLHHPADVVR